MLLISIAGRIGTTFFVAFCVLCIGVDPAVLFLSCAGMGTGSIPPSAPPLFPEGCMAG